MKRLIIIFLVLIFTIATWYGESRRFYSIENGRCATVWKTYNNVCYIIPYKYYGLFKPSTNDNYIQTTNRSSGVDLIYKNDFDTVLVQTDKGSQIHNNTSAKIIMVNYNFDKGHNDHLYTYYDSKLHLTLYKKKIPLIAVTIDDMGAL